MMDRPWLSRVSEAAIEPDLEIVDSHHHLWATETRYGRYELADLREDTGTGHNVVETVFIDCGSNYWSDGPEALKPVGETEYVSAVAKESELSAGATIGAIVGHADLSLGSSVEEVLHAHIAAGNGRFRGIRHSGARAADAGTNERGEPAVPPSRTQPAVGLYGQPAFRDGARVLASLGLSFEAWQYHYQLSEVAALAAAIPDLTVIVNHLGGPLGVGRFAGRQAEVMAELQQGLGPLAALPNVLIKLGGIGMTRYGTGWETQELPPTSDMAVDRWGDLIRWVIDLFGPERCMFESNYPVDGETISYGVLWNTFKKISDRYGDGERADLFAGTARRAYRL